MLDTELPGTGLVMALLWVGRIYAVGRMELADQMGRKVTIPGSPSWALLCVHAVHLRQHIDMA